MSGLVSSILQLGSPALHGWASTGRSAIVTKARANNICAAEKRHGLSMNGPDLIGRYKTMRVSKVYGRFSDARLK
jgi:hypothetical protein